MTRSVTRSVALGAVLSIMLAAAQPGRAARAPEFRAPPDTQVSWISQNMLMNGIPMQVRRFVTRNGVQDVVDFYRKEWGDGTPEEPGFVVNTMLEPWFIVSRVEDEYLMTVQVQHSGDGGAWGYLALGRLSDQQKGPTIGRQFPMLSGSQTLNEVISQDPGKKGRTMQIANDHSLQNNVTFYRDQYSGDGWTLELDRGLGNGMHVLTARKGRQQINLVITAIENRSRIVVNEVTNEVL